MSENEIQRILDKLEELRDEMRDQSIAWHDELNSVKIQCAIRGDNHVKMKAYMDAHAQTNDQWLESTVGRKALMIISGIAGAAGYMLLQNYIARFIQ